jgi:hypothetical protein
LPSWSVTSSGIGIFNVAASWAENYVAALSVPTLIRDLAHSLRPAQHTQLFVAKRRKKFNPLWRPRRNRRCCQSNTGQKQPTIFRFAACDASATTG